MSFVEAWKELEIIILRQIPYDIAYMWNLKYDTNVLTYKTQTHRHENRLLFVKRESEGGNDGLGL